MYLTHFDNIELSEQYYTILFAGNRVVTTLMLYITSSPEHLAITLNAWGPLEPQFGGVVENAFGSLFRDVDASFVAKASSRPAVVGAIVDDAGKHILFAFHVRRGALKSLILQEEIQNSLKIEREKVILN